MGDDCKVDGRDIVFVKRFIHPTDPSRWADVELSGVSASTADDAKLDATIIIVNGDAPDIVKALDEYVPSGLIEGQGLLICKKEDWGENIVVIYDGDPMDGHAIDLIYAKEPADRPSSGTSGGSCDMGAGIAALTGLAATALRKRGR